MYEKRCIKDYVHYDHILVRAFSRPQQMYTKKRRNRSRLCEHASVIIIIKLRVLKHTCNLKKKKYLCNLESRMNFHVQMMSQRYLTNFIHKLAWTLPPVLFHVALLKLLFHFSIKLVLTYFYELMYVYSYFILLYCIPSFFLFFTLHYSFFFSLHL